MFQMSHQIGMNQRKGWVTFQNQKQTIVIFHPTSRLVVTTMAQHKLQAKEQHCDYEKCYHFKVAELLDWKTGKTKVQ